MFLLWEVGSCSNTVPELGRILSIYAARMAGGENNGGIYYYSTSGGGETLASPDVAGSLLPVVPTGGPSLVGAVNPAGPDGGRPMEGITDPLPLETSGLVMALGSGFTEDLSGSKPLQHSVSDMDVDNNIVEVHDEPMFGSDRGWSFLKFTDAMRQKA